MGERDTVRRVPWRRADSARRSGASAHGRHTQANRMGAVGLRPLPQAAAERKIGSSEVTAASSCESFASETP